MRTAQQVVENLKLFYIIKNVVRHKLISFKTTITCFAALGDTKLQNFKLSFLSFFFTANI